jgi:alanine racemase
MAYITLNKQHFFHNLDIIAAKTKSKEKIALVLKDNAYGHGLLEVASMAKEYGITKAVVRCQVEAMMVREFFDSVLVLAEIPNEADEKIAYTINDKAQIALFPPHTKVHLKVDTGMGRNGIKIEELQETLSLLKHYNLQLQAVFTHHSSADETTQIYAQQKERFLEVKQLCKSFVENSVAFHSCNSAALMREEDFDESIARVGIAAYGCLEMPYLEDETLFKPVLSLYAQKISSRILEKGECVGYGATFCAQESCVVSNYDVGYADGFFRACSNTYVTPQNIPIVGRISMDNSSFATQDEELLIFNDARKVALHVSTISYEVLTALKPYIKRIII